MISQEVRPQPAGQDADSGFMETPFKHSQVLSASEQENPVRYDATKQIRGSHVNLLETEIWSSSFSTILDDEEGSRIFYQYLETEQSSILFELWHECQKYKASPPNKATAKKFQARYIRVKDVRVPVSDQARNNLAIRIRNNNIEDDLLDEIESEVYQSLRDVWYIRFLKSDFLRSIKDRCYQEVPSSIVTSFKSGYADGKPVYAPQISSHPAADSLMLENRVSSFHSKDACSELVRDTDRISLGSVSATNHGRGCHHDDLPTPKDFRPRTQRMNREKPMPPAEFARLLSEKLSKVLAEQSLQESRSTCEDSVYGDTDFVGAHVKRPSHVSCHAPPLPSGATSENSSYVLPCDKRSVAGQSSHSGSGAISQVDSLVYKESAKELMKSIKRQLKGTMKECNCQTCTESCRSVSGFPYVGTTHLRDTCRPCTNGSRAVEPYSGCGLHHRDQILYNQEDVLSQTAFPRHNFAPTSINSSAYAVNCPSELDPSVDSAKILNWMEKNAQYSQQSELESCPSPGSIRKTSRQPVVYNSSRGTPLLSAQPIASDPGMPPLPPPNTSTVLEEVNRRLQSASGSCSQSATLRRHAKPTAAYSQPGAHGVQLGQGYTTSQDRSVPTGPHLHAMFTQQSYADFDGRSSIGDASQWSDSRSSVSFNAGRSEISSVPSSASRLWQLDARSEVQSDGWVDETCSASFSDHRYASMRAPSDAPSGHYSEPRSLTNFDARYFRPDLRLVPAGSQDRPQPPIPDIRSDGRSEAFSQSSGGRSAGSGSSKSQLRNSTTVTYYFCADPIPFRISVPSRDVTLAQFKEQTKKGNFSYFFKTVSEDDGEVVFFEVKNDHDYLPRYKDKIVGRVIKNE